MIESELVSIRIVLVKVTLKTGQEKHLISILFWKPILGLIKTKDLNGEKIMERFYEKSCCGINWTITQNQTVTL